MDSASNPAIRTLSPTPKIVFVVDDDPAHARACARILQNAGYRVVAAANGVSALRSLALAPVDLVLLDAFMPEKDGFETLDTIRRHHPRLPVIAMSGGSTFTPADDVLAQCHPLGATALLAKPFADTELLAAVASALATSHPPL